MTNSQAQNYCDANGNSTTDEWIQSITIGDFVSNTGNDNGYEDNTNQTINLAKNTTYNFSLNPGYAGDEFPEYWRIWIDYNDDGDFNDNNELVYDAGQPNDGAITGSFTIPSNINNNNTRMRIAMKWAGTYNDGTSDLSPPNSCGTFDFGEVEDYSVNIQNEAVVDNYCSNTSNDSSGEWIQSFGLGEYNNNSGNDDGYGNFTSNTNTIDVERGTTYQLNLNPGYASTQYTEHWRIWIDYNNDNDFNDSGEMVYDSGSGVEGNISTSFGIGSSVPLGESRLRVAMKWVGDYNDGTSDFTPPNACGTFEFGEVEDYTINIEQATTTAPIAEFNSNTTSGASPLTVNFFDQSTNNPTTWNWSFPGGTPSTSTEQNPTVVYNNTGTYSVTLNVTNAAGNNTKTKTGYINVSNELIAPVAEFSSNVQTGQTPLNVQFNDLSTNSPTAWNWSFEGGTPATSAQQNPAVVYNTPGTYAVTLIASNAAGNDTQTKQGFITVNDPTSAPIANFVADETIVNAGAEINFIDQSTNSPTAWIWSFEGGSPASSTLQNPSVVYNVPGTYNVSLTVSNSIGANMTTKEGYIVVSEQVPLPIASFGASIFQGPAPLVVTFFDMSDNEPTNWSWEFPGAVPGSSNEKNPTVTYNDPGTFQVTLTVTNEAGSDSKTQVEYIVVDQPFAVGIEEVEDNFTSQNDITIYPNPSTGMVNINGQFAEAQTVDLQVINLLGQEIDNIHLGTIQEVNQQLDLNHLPTGMYWISLMGEKETINKAIKIVK